MPDIRLIDANALARYIETDWIIRKKSRTVHSSMDDAQDFTFQRCLTLIERIPTIDAQPVKSMKDKAHWTYTDETVWEARDKDSGQEFEISIVAAKCSACERWAEQVNQFPPYMKYEYCPNCGRKMGD